MVLEIIATADLSRHRQILSARLLRDGAGHARSSHYGKKAMPLSPQYLDSVQRWRYERGKGCASSNPDRLDPKVEGNSILPHRCIVLLRQAGKGSTSGECPNYAACKWMLRGSRSAGSTLFDLVQNHAIGSVLPSVAR